MKIIEIIQRVCLLMLGLVLCSVTMAAPVLITGNVKNIGINASDHYVGVSFPGTDTSTITDVAGNYSIVVDPQFNSGILDIKSINCIGDTVVKKAFFSVNQMQLLVNFNLCENNYSTYIRGSVFYKEFKAPMVKVEFSLNNFKTILEFVHTNNAGEYGIQLFTGPNDTGTMSARITNSDGVLVTNHGQFSRDDTVVIDLVKRKPLGKSLVTGQVKRGDQSTFANEIMLYLYGLDPLDHQMKIVDSTISSSGGAYNFLINDTLNYLLRAVPTSVQSNIAPAYTHGSLYWDEDKVLHTTNLGGLLRKNVELNQLVPSQGSNTIRGRVEYENAELTLNRAPVLLLNENDQIVSFTFLSSDNAYEFENVPPGFYHIWIDDPGKETEPLQITLIGENDVIEAQSILVNSFSVRPKQSLQIESKDLQNALTLYPNPFVDELRVNYQGGETLTVQVYSISGGLLIERTLQQGEFVPTSQLSPGVYLTRILHGNNSVTQKLIKR